MDLVNQPVDEKVRLSGTRTGIDKNDPFIAQYGLLLLVIETFQVIGSTYA